MRTSIPTSIPTRVLKPSLLVTKSADPHPHPSWCRYCDPHKMGAIRRRDSPDKMSEYLLRAEFRMDEDSSGCNDTRWLTIGQMRESGVDVSTIKEKLTAWEAALASTREAELEAELEGGEGERQSADAELRQRAETES